MATNKEEESKKENEILSTTKTDDTNQTNELEGFLTDYFNFNIYQNIESSSLFNPLEFFKFFYLLLDLVKEGKSLSAIKQINKTNFTDGQKLITFYYLLEKLDDELRLMDSSFPEYDRLSIQSDLIKAEYDKLNNTIPFIFDPLSDSIDVRAKNVIELDKNLRNFLQAVVKHKMQEHKEKLDIEERARQDERNRIYEEMISSQRVNNPIMANEKQKKTYLAQVDEYIIDEFHWVLDEVATTSYWNEIMQGKLRDELAFFKYLQEFYDKVLSYKDNPRHLKWYLQNFNPSDQPRNMGGIAKDVANDNLPIERQRLFLLNALDLMLKNRDVSDEKQRVILRIVNDELHTTHLTIFANHYFLTENTLFDDLRNNLPAVGGTSAKANYLISRMGELLHQEGYSLTDVDTWQKQMSFFNKILTEPNYDYSKYFKDAETSRFFHTLYYEIIRMIELLRLEGLEHAPIQEIDSEKQIDENESEDERNEGVEKRNQEATIARRVMAISHLLIAAGLKNEIEQTEIARFAAFLMGSPEDNIKNGNIYKKLRNPISVKSQKAEDDLKYVRERFKRLQLNEIAKKISAEIRAGRLP